MTTETAIHTIEYVSVNDIQAAPFNPASRTEKRALTRLRRAIENAGRIIVPLVLSGDNVLADGHRRLAIAKELGYETVPVIRDSAPVAELWSTLGEGLLAPRPHTWMEAVHGGLPLGNVPDNLQATIGDLRRIAGPRLFDKLAEKRRSPNIINQARMVGRHCGDTSDKFLRKVLTWFETHGQQLEARKAVDADCPPEVLIAAIEEERPIRQFWGIA